MTENHGPGHSAIRGLLNERLRFEKGKNTNDKGEVGERSLSLRKQRGQKCCY
jgi:hypothetical protein